MIGIEVCGGNLLVTSSALGHDIELESFDIGSANGVSRVAIVADGKFLIRLVDHRRVDALNKLLLDSMMAPAACCGDILGIDTRRGIRDGKDVVCRVAVAAGCRDGQSAFQQTLPVDAFRVVGNDLMLRSGVPDGGFLPFLVTLAAKPRDVEGEDGGLWIGPTFHLVRAMTFLAGWSVRIIVGNQLAVHAFLELLTHFCVA